MSTENNELRNRIAASDSASGIETASELTVTTASQRRGKRAPLSRRKLRAALGTGAAGATASVLALTMALNVQAQPLLRLGAEPMNQGSASAESMNAGGLAASADAKMAIWPMVEYKYLAGPNLSDQGGSGQVYQLALNGDPKQRVEQLATLFGVEGEAVLDEWSTPEYPSYSVQGDNFWLGVYWSGTGSWSYSTWTPWPEECYSVEPAPVDESGSTEESAGETSLPAECGWQTEPTPELIPSESEMSAAALEIMSATGLSASASDLKIYRDDWGASVSASLKVDGQETALEWYVGWGADGTLTYASGHTVSITERGTYNTISPKEAVSRLGDWRWFGGVSSSVYQRLYDSMPTLRSAVEYDSAVASGDGDVAESSPEVTVEPTEWASSNPDEGATAEPTESAAPQPTDEATLEPLPVDPMPTDTEVQVVELTVDSAEAALVLIYDANGGAWLVPGWIMINSEGWFDSIIGLEDGVIELPEPMEYDIMPLPAVKETD
jgi:hypothetical protein